MCLILFAYQKHSQYPLVMVANRDEFYARPTEPAQFWEGHKGLLAGKDLEGGGTWLGVNSKTGKLAALTNYRDPAHIKQGAPSRGALVTDFLKGSQTVQDYMEGVLPQAAQYNGFNLLLGSTEALYYYSNYINGVKAIPKGLYGLSNHLLNSEWPKVTKGKQKLEAILESEKIQPEYLFEAMLDSEMASDAVLPNTGIGLEKERILSPMFIKSPGYGSRCSTVLLVDKKHRATFIERTFDPTTFAYTDQSYEFQWG